MTVAVADGLVAWGVQLRTKDETTVEMPCEAALHHYLGMTSAEPPTSTHSLLVDIGRLMLVIFLCDACAARAREDVPE